jgi:hypothetical protein
MPFTKIASDIGGVLLAGRHAAEGDTADHEAEASWLDGALEGLRGLTATHTVYLLSFCGKKTEDATRARLKAADVHTWLPEERWLFCRDRKHKPRLMKEHNIELLIDDRGDIIRNVREKGLVGIHFKDWASALAEFATLDAGAAAAAEGGGGGAGAGAGASGGAAAAAATGDA